MGLAFQEGRAPEWQELSISYYATDQWQVATLNPPHLAAICPWEGADSYRGLSRHGGILSRFWGARFQRRVLPVQSGRIYPVAVEPWPTTIVIPAGYRLALTIRGGDYQYREDAGAGGIEVRVRNGSGMCAHGDLADRDVAALAGQVTIHSGPTRDSHLLLPVVTAGRTGWP